MNSEEKYPESERTAEDKFAAGIGSAIGRQTAVDPSAEKPCSEIDESFVELSRSLSLLREQVFILLDSIEPVTRPVESADKAGAGEPDAPVKCTVARLIDEHCGTVHSIRIAVKETHSRIAL